MRVPRPTSGSALMNGLEELRPISKKMTALPLQGSVTIQTRASLGRLSLQWAAPFVRQDFGGAARIFVCDCRFQPAALPPVPLFIAAMRSFYRSLIITSGFVRPYGTRAIYAPFLWITFAELLSPRPCSRRAPPRHKKSRFPRGRSHAHYCAGAPLHHGAIRHDHYNLMAAGLSIALSHLWLCHALCLLE